MYPYRQYSPAKAILRVAIVSIVAFAIFRMFGKPSNRPAGQGGAASNAIQERLAPPAGVEQKFGIAVAILVDTSGSMSTPVSAADGTQSPKMQIAQQAVLNLVKMSEDFTTQHPDTPTLVGIYAFSDKTARPVVPLGTPKLSDAESPVRAMRPRGDTPIGEALITAKKDLDATGLSRQHILVVTDGENTSGPPPAPVLKAMSATPNAIMPGVYFVAFDVNARVFNDAKANGAMVISASNEEELQNTVSTLFSTKILVE